MISLPRTGEFAAVRTVHGRRMKDVPAILGAFLVAGVAACTGGASQPPQSPAGSASASAPPVGSASPSQGVDVAAAFIERMALMRSGTLDVGGTFTFGPLGGDVSGEMAFSGSNSRSSMTISLAGNDQVQESVRIGDESWTRTQPGPWLVDETPPTSDTLGEFLKTLLAVEDLGIETRGGRDLHHLGVPSGSEISPAAIGIDTELMKDPRVALDFYAGPDGTPVIMVFEVGWSQDAGGQDLPAEMTLDFAFAGLDDSLTIEPPDDVWQTYASDAAGYSMAHPGDWTVESKGGEDAYLIDGQPYVYVYSQTLPRGMGTTGFHEELVRGYRRDFGTPADADEEVQLGGQPARRLVYHFTNDNGVDVALVDYLLVNGRTGYEVILATAAGPGEEDDIALFETFVATFKFLS
jgi:hypothetical protein